MVGPLRNVASRLLVAAHESFERALHEYEEAQGVAAFWMMCDLRSSAKFRIASGEQAAFVRAFGFVEICRRLGSYFSDVQVFKELGDAVLVRATDARELLEFLVLLDLTGAYARVDEERDPRYPSLSMRSAITFGTAFKVGADYLGQPIDRLARVSGFKQLSDNTLAVLDSAARAQFIRLLEEYPYVDLSDSMQVPAELLKEGEPTFRLHLLEVNRTAAADSRDFFARVRRSIVGADFTTGG